MSSKYIISRKITKKSFIANLRESYIYTTLEENHLI